MSYGKVITEEDIYKIMLDISTKGFDNVVKQPYIPLQKVPFNEEPEQWEIDLREKLNKEVEDGCYKLGTGCYGGKQAYIDFEIALAKLIRREPKDEL